MSEGRLANLVIAGVPKAGTVSLFSYLTQHPDVCGSDEKEIGYFNYFDPRRHTGSPPPIDEYTRHFAHWAGERYLLEATPTYSYGGRPVIAGIRQVLGSPRIVIILREPAERLWSAYTFQRSIGNMGDIRSFEHYLDVLEQRNREGAALVPKDGRHGLLIGFYADYIPDWLDEFGEDLRIVFAEDLRSSPRTELEGLCTWLGIDAGVVATLDLQARNVTRHPRSARLARTARTIARRGDRLHLLPPAARRRLQGAYARVNSGGELAERFDPALRQHVQELYRESNERTAGVLAAHGYSRLPAWLQVRTAA
jgi:hypothetical protein